MTNKNLLVGLVLSRQRISGHADVAPIVSASVPKKIVDRCVGSSQFRSGATRQADRGGRGLLDGVDRLSQGRLAIAVCALWARLAYRNKSEDLAAFCIIPGGSTGGIVRGWIAGQLAYDVVVSASDVVIMADTPETPFRRRSLACSVLQIGDSRRQ